MSKINNAKAFSATINGVKKSMTTVRNDVQSLFVYAFAQYEAHGNTTFLNRIRAAAVTSKALPAAAIEEYACKYANVTYAAKKFTSKNGKNRTVGTLDSKWFDNINKDGEAPAPKPTDIIKLIKGLEKTIGKKAEGNLLTDNEKQVNAATEMLESMVSKLGAMGFTTTAK